MHITLDAGVDAPGTARHEMAGQRSRMRGRFEDALIVVTELVTNSVLHGPPGGTIDLVTSVTERSVHIDVTDYGNCFQGLPPDGHGLQMVSAIATRWGVVRGSCLVWADLDFTASTADGDVASLDMSHVRAE
ncbi:MAG TPA: ATP-binding protein [Acidimicrobiia bacterium]|nr:ATP-binding protein [Acidimicrobiia bacterium]